MLTIGELAGLAGTTVRAVRHYHAVGLLPEPERDHSGYRRYGAAALVRLLRVRRMRELGLPLDRIAELLGGTESGLHDALDALDAELADQAERIAARRARLAELRASNPDPELPEPLARVFAGALADGVPARALQQEKDVVLLHLALHPDRAEATIAEYEQLYAGLRPAHQELTVRFDALADTDPGDEEIDALAHAFVELIEAQVDATPDGRPPTPQAERVFRSWGDELPPGQRRLMERVAELLEGRGVGGT